MQHQHGSQPAGIIFIVRFMDSFLHQASFVTGNWCYDRHRSVRLVICDVWRLIRSHNPG
ncbi:hypothetical protein A676_00658 [Salmonella enterica subsp. enterica serovar Enteritidis str. 2010K-0262]|nr:hypothetical protein A676_00658 [Salmonella enterica subsp. enterica serovar Enteritidis str. 2010K-0262]